MITHITVHASAPNSPGQAPIAQARIDNEAFTDNVFKPREAAAQPISQPRTSRYGRELRPVDRLNISEM